MATSLLCWPHWASDESRVQRVRLVSYLAALHGPLPGISAALSRRFGEQPPRSDVAIELLDAVSNLGRLDGEASAAAASATLVREGAACLAEAAAPAMAEASAPSRGLDAAATVEAATVEAAMATAALEEEAAIAAAAASAAAEAAIAAAAEAAEAAAEETAAAAAEAAGERLDDLARTQRVRCTLCHELPRTGAAGSSAASGNNGKT